MKRKTGFIILLIIILAFSYHVFFKKTITASDHEDAIEFCESMIPLLESYKAEYGDYPNEIKSEWIEGKKIPKLIRVKDFYLKAKDGYLLRFQNPSDSFLIFGDDVYGYHSMPPWNGKWLNYDGY